MFQRLEAALSSEIAALGHPRAALLAFGVAMLAHNVLALEIKAKGWADYLKTLKGMVLSGPRRMF